MHKLIISDDEGKTTVVPLVRDEITIGRKEGNTIRLTERNVSRRHARLVRANGSFQIEDLGSYNGIRLNGVRIADKSSVKEGDQIQIGDYQLALQSDKAVAKPPAEEAVTVATAVPESAPAPAAADVATELITVPVEETIPMEAPRTTQSARLVLVSAPAPGQEFQLAKDEMVIGRAEDCDVSINHRSMSREHAKILRVDQAYRILDLESANGVRVNGQDVPYAELRRGDVVELGHVRLRFVAPGEIYRFDGDATIQMSASVGFGRSSRAPIWVLAAALLLAGGVALYLASRPIEPVTPSRPTPTAVPSVPPQVPDPEPTFNVAKLLDDARLAMREGRYEEALASASQAHRQERANAEAEQLVHEITRLLEAKAYFDAGRRKLDAGDPEGAYAEFDRIPPATAPYDDAVVIDLMERVLKARLAQARQALGRSDLEQARQLATSITDAQRANGDGAPAKLVAVRTSAETLLRTVEERERIAQANAIPDPVQEQQRQQQLREQQLREQQRQQELREQREQREQQQQRELQQQQEQREQREQQEQTQQPAGNPRDCGPIVSTSAARCFLAASGGNAAGEYMLRNLILAHTLLGDRGRARPLASRYFEQYGTSPFARQIRQLGYSP